MKLIPLTQGKFAMVDDSDYEWLNQWKWHASNNHGKNWYAMSNIDGKRVKMHRIILGLTDPKILGDHINRDGLNNQRSNLRIANNSQNQCNSKKRDGTSIYRGVQKSKGVYTSKIQFNNKREYLGQFPFTPCGELLAALAYDEAAQKIHGEFANLNFK